MTESAIPIWLTIYYWYISINWVPFHLIGPVLNITALIGLPFIPESPKFLYEKKRYMECYKSLRKMADINGVKGEKINLFHEILTQQNGDQSILKLNATNMSSMK